MVINQEWRAYNSASNAPKFTNKKKPWAQDIGTTIEQQI
jgi:hypothetical protein